MMRHKISVFVPCTVGNEAGPTEQNTWVQRLLAAMAGMFGGATVIDAQGAWMGLNGLVIEPVRIVFAYADDRAFGENHALVLELAAAMRGDMKQEAVAVEIDGSLLLLNEESAQLAAVA